MIDQEIINTIKEGIDLVPFIQGCGIDLKQSGKSYKGYCPFHEDKKSPSLSVTPSENLWQCFGCGKGGDVIDFAKEFDGTDFHTTVEKLETYIPSTNSSNASTKTKKKPVKKKKESEPPSLTPAHYKLLQRVVDFYHTAFNEDSRALDYLHETRGITNKTLFADYKIGFANGTLLNVLPDDGKTITQLKELGILNKKGKEHFYGCATFPLYDSNNNPVGMYGRRIPEFDFEPHHLYLPGGRKGIFNRQGAGLNSDIHLTESILDSLTLINGGTRNTIPCYGTNGFTADIRHHLKQSGITTAYIVFDADKAGKEGSKKLSATLAEEKIKTCPVNLPEGLDLNNFFNSSEIKAPQTTYNDLILIAAGLEPAPRASKSEYKANKTGFLFTSSERQYEVKGINRKNNKLKATVKGIADNKKSKSAKSTKRFHVDTVDFYSSRSRAFLCRGLADLFGVKEQLVSDDLEKLLEYTENYQPPEETDQAQSGEITEKDKTAALKFLKSPHLLNLITEDLETIGFTGEEMNKLLCYLAAVSRKMSDPLSVMIQSRSAAGKSCLQDTILSLIPEEDFIKYTRLTDQALFYKESNALKHRILAIEELDGMNGAIYSIRTIQSSKKITVAYTGKDPMTGEMKTGENTVEGPLMIFITTTQVEIDGETASRFVFISIDESQEMTEKILCKQRQSHTMEGMMARLKSKKVISKHLAAQRLLQPIRVINPFADLLTFNSKSLRARRDHMKYLNLILTITFLFQYQRPHLTMDYDGEQEEYIEVSLDDIEKANEIAAEVLGRSLDELSPSSRKLLILIRKMAAQQSVAGDQTPEEQISFTRRDIREYSGWSDFQVKTHIKQLEELEYIYSLTGRKGKEYVYELIYREDSEDNSSKKFLIGLTDITEIKKQLAETKKG